MNHDYLYKVIAATMILLLVLGVVFIGLIPFFVHYEEQSELVNPYQFSNVLRVGARLQAAPLREIQEEIDEKISIENLHVDQLVDFVGCPILWAAVADGRLDVVQWLVAEKSATPDVVFKDITPLHVAAVRGRIHEAELLLQVGANPDLAIGETPSAREAALKSGNNEMIELFSRYPNQDNTQKTAD